MSQKQYTITFNSTINYIFHRQDYRDKKAL